MSTAPATGPGAMPRSSSAPSGRRVFSTAFLATWAAAVLVVGAALMVPHVIALPAPRTSDVRLSLAVRELSRAAQGRWIALHVLYEGCGCSARVFEHLNARRARADLSEQIVYVRDAPLPDADVERAAARGRDAGFRFESLTPAELEARYQIESVPLLVIADATGRIRYSGGYTEKSGAAEIDDVSIIEGARAGRDVEPRPVFGCAVSSRMQEAIDPFRLKYTKRNSQ